MIGYTVAKNENVNVIVTLEIPEDAVTDMNRNDIVDIITATYITDKAKVVSIEDNDGNTYESATLRKYYQDYICDLEYSLNNYVKFKNNDSDDCEDEDDYYAETDFYLTKKMAQIHTVKQKDFKDGVFQRWFPNGQLHEQCSYVNNKKDGLNLAWYKSGNILMKVNYSHGKNHGLYQSFHENGAKYVEVNCINDKFDGLYQEWHKNGSLHMYCTYVNGNKEGPYKTYYDDGEPDIIGTVCIECNYVNGKFDGYWKKYTNWGYPEVVHLYKDGVLV